MEVVIVNKDYNKIKHSSFYCSKKLCIIMETVIISLLQKKKYINQFSLIRGLQLSITLKAHLLFSKTVNINHMPSIFPQKFYSLMPKVILLQTILQMEILNFIQQIIKIFQTMQKTGYQLIKIFNKTIIFSLITIFI